MCTIVYALSYHLHHIQVRFKVDDVIIHAGVHAVFSAIALQKSWRALFLFQQIGYGDYQIIINAESNRAIVGASSSS